MSARHLPVLAAALVLVSACASAPPKPAVPVAAAPAAPAPCQEGPGGPKARVAGGQTVDMTSCARPAPEWAADRPGVQALRPGNTH